MQLHTQNKSWNQRNIINYEEALKKTKKKTKNQVHKLYCVTPFSINQTIIVELCLQIDGMTGF